MAVSFELVSYGQTAVAARAWRARGRRLLTVVVKATFQLRADAQMVQAAPTAICPDERHLWNHPTASLAHASDLALVVPNPEIVILGCAYAPGGRPTETLSVRLVVQRDRATLVDKRLDIVGDRRALPGAPAPSPVPFERMPIQYERSQRGRDNPVGCGVNAAPDGYVLHPNVLLPASGGVAPAGLGPIASAWPMRARLRGSLDAAAANTANDVELPGDFDDAYFQTAPADQRTGEIVGGELITLQNLHPTLPTLRTLVPSLRGVVRIQPAKGAPIALSTRIDTVLLEPDAMRGEILYRGTMVLSDALTSHLVIEGALETPERPFVFPEAARAPNVAGTLLLDPGPASAPKPNLPFNVRRPVPPAPPPPSTAAVAGPAGTMVLDAPATPTSARQAGTMIAEPAPPSARLPFAGTKRKRSGQVPQVVAENAATPWSQQGKLAPVAPAREAVASTMFQEEPAPAPKPDEQSDEPEVMPAPAEKPAPAPVENNAPPSAQVAREITGDPWRKDATEPVARKPAAPPPAIAPRADVKNALYKRLKK